MVSRKIESTLKTVMVLIVAMKEGVLVICMLLATGMDHL